MVVCLSVMFCLFTLYAHIQGIPKKKKKKKKSAVWEHTQRCKNFLWDSTVNPIPQSVEACMQELYLYAWPTTAR